MKQIFTRIILIMIAFIYQNNVMAQRIHHLQPQLFKISFDDDYFNYRMKGTDKYYTAGLEFSVYFKKYKPQPPQLNNVQSLDDLYFLSLKQTMNTPNEISRTGFQKGDYPYAGVLAITYGKIHSDQNSRFTKAISVGVLGPQAFAGETQTFVHGIINYTKPRGWDSQLSGQLLLNFMAGYEKEIYSKGNRLDVTGNIGFNAGTVYTNAGAGLTIRAGKLNSYFSNYESVHLGGTNRYQKTIYFFVNPSVTIVGYDATLQGAFVNQSHYKSKDVYSVNADSMNHVIGKINFGIKYEGRRMSYSISQFIQTPTFNTVSHHEYGNVSISFKLNDSNKQLNKQQIL